MLNSRLIYAGLVALCAIAAGLWLYHRSSLRQQAATSAGQNASQEQGSESLDVATAGNPEAGGSSGRENPAVPGKNGAVGVRPKRISDKEQPPNEVQHFGRIEPIKGDATPQAASVLEALKNKDHPERLSALLPPKKPFDKTEFEADPDKYLKIVEPGRVFQTARPGPKVPTLTATSARMVRMKQGQSVKLSVKGEPLAPVSFTSFDAGSFAESKLNCVTVRADKDGLATATFVASSGALNDCNILAGSPLAAGQVKFVAEIEEAQIRK